MMVRMLGTVSRTSSSLSTCSWFSAKATVISASCITNVISVATASWYSGTGTAPSAWAATKPM